MGHRHAGRGFVLGVSLLALLGAGCTPDTPTPPPTTNTSATPTESAQEREERLAYAAAEKSYREFRAEFYRVLNAGGAKSSTETMKRTAAGPYLKYFTEVAQAYKGEGNRSVGTEKSGFIRPQGYSSTSLLLEVCEDSREVRDFNRSGKQIGRGEVRVAQLEAHLIDGEWKIWDGTGKKTERCE
jgi:hypothetical protein